MYKNFNDKKDTCNSDKLKELIMLKTFNTLHNNDISLNQNGTTIISKLICLHYTANNLHHNLIKLY